MTMKFSELRARMSPESRARAEVKAQGMLEHLNTDLRAAVHEGMTSGPAVPADQVLAAAKARYAALRPDRRSGIKRRV